MTTEFSPTEPEDRKAKGNHQSGSMDTVYGLGLIGAWIFYIGRATSVREGVLGFLKGLIWPVFLVHGLLVSLDQIDLPDDGD